MASEDSDQITSGCSAVHGLCDFRDLNNTARTKMPTIVDHVHTECELLEISSLSCVQWMSLEERNYRPKKIISAVDDELGKIFEHPLEKVVIIAIARIDRDVAAIRTRQSGKRIVLGCVGQAERDDAPRLGPECLGMAALRCPLGHPAHIAVLAGCDEFHQPFPHLWAEFGTAKAHRVEAEREGPVEDQRTDRFRCW